MRPRITYALAFSPDYATARERFRHAAEARGCRLEAHAIDRTGPRGDDLTIDVAILGSEWPERVVLVSSGLHGVEGFFGSAVQVALLEQGPKLPQRTSLVLVHALDPFGFAWLRRFNEENIDLNRNFLLEGERYEGCSPKYKELNDLLNPPCPPRWFDPFRLKALMAIARHGMAALKQAVAGGQYEYPRGLFFGGKGPSRTRQILDEHLPRWVGSARQVIHVDFHTGLGRWARYKLLLDDAMKPRQAWLARVFGAERLEFLVPGGIAYHTRGDLYTWCRAHIGRDRCYDAVCAEFGTYRPLSVIAALRAENQAHHWGRPDEAETRRAKSRLKEVFAPRSRRWRDATVAQGVEIVRRAIEAATDRGC